VIGEGGSGGAARIGVGAGGRRAAFAYYSVISPEGGAGILWKKPPTSAPDAARRLKLTSKSLQEVGCVEYVIEEPLGGRHSPTTTKWRHASRCTLKSAERVVDMPTDKLLRRALRKFRSMGQFLEGDAADSAPAAQKRQAVVVSIPQRVDVWRPIERTSATPLRFRARFSLPHRC